MPSRAELEVRAQAAGVEQANYPNDSKLEQAVIYAEKAATFTAGNPAVGTLTSDATAPEDGDTVTIGGVTYTFKTALTSATAANEVLIGVSAATALDNLKSAINKTAGGGTTYGSLTSAHPTVTATTNTDTTQVVSAIVTGTGGNAIATTEVSDHLSWGAGTLAGGTADTGPRVVNLHQLSGGKNI